MTRLAFVRYVPEMKSQWDDVVKRSKNGNFLHFRDYMDYHGHRFQDESVVVMDGSRPVAVFPCNREADVVVSHRGLTYAGLIFGPDLHATDVLEIFEALAEYFRARGATRLLYKPVPTIFHRYPAQEDLYALFRIGGRLNRRDLSSAIHMPGRPKLSPSRMSTIHKASRSGVTVQESIELSAFHALLEEALQKFGAKPVHSVAELEMLKERFPSQITLFTAQQHGNLFAGALVYDFGSVAHTQYLATSKDGRQVGAMDLLLWELITKRFHDRQYFSFGISTQQEGTYLNAGLIFQKEGFGARGVVHDHYEVILKEGSKSAQLQATTTTWRDAQNGRASMGDKHPIIRPAARVRGATLNFRNATSADAEFILSLRTDPKKSRFLHATSESVAAQKEWLAGYAEGSGEAYFVIESNDEPMGTVRLYDAREHSFCWGSWILKDGAARQAAIESALMVYAYAIDHLGFTAAHFDVRRNNERVWQFHERFGAVRTAETEEDYFYVLGPSAIAASRARFSRYLPAGVSVEF